MSSINQNKKLSNITELIDEKTNKNEETVGAGLIEMTPVVNEDHELYMFT